MTGTLPDPQAVLAALGWTATAPPQVLAGGWDNHLWRFATHDGAAHVLRVYREAGPSAEARAANEAAAMQAAGVVGVPVAVNESIGIFEGAPAFVQSLVPGRTLLDAIKHRPWRLAASAREFGALQARIHRGEPGDAVRRIDAANARVAIGAGPLADALAGEARIDALCHLDYHPLNVLAQGGITAVLDWTNAAFTDRRADLAFTETALLRIPLPPSPINPLLTAIRRPLHRHWREGYRSEAGDFPLTPLFQAASVVMFLADLEGAVREGRGWASAADVETMRAEGDRLLRLAGIS